MTQDNQFVIVNGPNKWNFFISLGEGNPVHRSKLAFRARLQKDGRLTMDHHIAVTGVDQEDGSGNKWIFRGYTETGVGGKQVKGFYNTQTRTGTFTFVG